MGHDGRLGTRTAVRRPTKQVEATRDQRSRGLRFGYSPRHIGQAINTLPLREPAGGGIDPVGERPQSKLPIESMLVVARADVFNQPACAQNSTPDLLRCTPSPAVPETLLFPHSFFVAVPTPLRMQ